MRRSRSPTTGALGVTRAGVVPPGGRPIRFLFCIGMLQWCGWCHTDLTDSIRAHLYGCAMLPIAIRRIAQAAREAARSLVKQRHQLRDAADVAVREAQATLHALRNAMRQSPLKRRE